MPKKREDYSSFLKRMSSSYPSEIKTDGKILFCKCCSCNISAKQLSQVKQHLETVQHQNAKKGRGVTTQSLISNFQQSSTNKTGPKLSDFNLDICKMFVEADIPLEKLSHSAVKHFVSRYTPYTTPDPSTIRKNYLPLLYKQSLSQMQAKAKNKYLWVSLDETTDCAQRYVANFIFGILGDADERDKSYLLTLASLEKVNNSTIATFFNDALLLLYPEGNSKCIAGIN